MITEDTYPHIAEFVNYETHSDVIDLVKFFLTHDEGLSKDEILEKIDICYDENNVPSTIDMCTIEKIITNIDDFEQFLFEINDI